MKTSLRSTSLCLGFLFTSLLVCMAQDFHTMAAGISQHISASGRKSVAVTDFTDLDGNPTELGRYLAEEFSDALFAEARGFEVIDRTHLKAILQEHKLATTGLIDPSTARMLGQIAGVDTLVTGTITPFEEHVHLSLKVIDTETARILAADTIDVPRTKTISDLIGPEPEAPSSKTANTAGATAKSQSADTSAALPPPVYSNQFLFVARGCEDKGGTMLCRFTVTDKSGSGRHLVITGLGFMIDDLGNQYNSPIMSFGGMNNQVVSSDMMPDVPASLTIELANVPSSVSTMNLSLVYIHPDGARYVRVMIHGIPVIHP